jgi:S-adenosylmethionine:tRNA ribosyltransferase-isomerase
LIVLVSDFDYELPADLIAQYPTAERDAARLLVLDRASGRRLHRVVADLPDRLVPGTLLVVNDTRVFPARLLGRRDPSGGAVECLLVARLDDDRWDALMHPGHKLRVGERVVFGDAEHRLEAVVLERRFFGRRVIRLRAAGGAEVDDVIDAIGHVPLPPYIRRPDEPADRFRYQTVFARERGSVAAPTAGLHFTESLVSRLDRRGIERAAITLHVGYGTFKPVRTAHVEDHAVDAEAYGIGEAAAARINAALDEGRRVVAVGTTTVRAIESAAIAGGGRVVAGAAVTDLFVHPGFTFQVIGGLLTNFHLPRSSLLMLVAAFAGRDSTLAAYREAVAERYRFYSYGDAMLVT